MIPVLAGLGAASSALAVGLVLWIVGTWCYREIGRQMRVNRRRREQYQRFEDALRRTKYPTYPLPREPRMIHRQRRREW